MRATVSSGLALVLCVGLAACGAEPTPTPAPEPEPAVEPEPTPEPEPAPVPEPEPEPEPTPANGGNGAAGGGDAAAGAALYSTYCASCHGERGEGDGPVAAGLNPKPARHSDGAYMNSLSNDYLTRVIKDGGTAVEKSPLMAPWGGTLSDAQIVDVIAFVRSLANPPYQP